MGPAVATGRWPELKNHYNFHLKYFPWVIGARWVKRDLHLLAAVKNLGNWEALFQKKHFWTNYQKQLLLWTGLLKMCARVCVCMCVFLSHIICCSFLLYSCQSKWQNLARSLPEKDRNQWNSRETWWHFIRDFRDFLTATVKYWK